MSGIITLLICLSAIFTMIMIHECGHYFAGIMVGIPFRQMKICLWTFPQYVAIKDSNNWISPLDYEKFVTKSKEYIKGKPRAIVFASGGFVLQSVAFITLIPLLKVNNIGGKFLGPATFAIVTQLFVYLLSDLRKPYGDFTSLLKLSKLAFYLIIVPVILIHVVVLVYILK
jgi:hypothetical protein